MARTTLPPSITGRRTAAQELAPDSYLTDGRRLFRVVSQFAAGSEHLFAALEDCLTLEIATYSPRELFGMRLRPVEVGDEAPTAVGS